MDEKNLELYKAFRSVPENAQRAITGGRLKGKTEINPLWRIKALTEVFGPCGIGWKYEIVKKLLEPCEQTGETAAFVDIACAVVRLGYCVFYQIVDLVDQIFNIAYRIGTGLRELSNLTGNNRESLAGFSGSGSFDRSV